MPKIETSIAIIDTDKVKKDMKEINKRLKRIAKGTPRLSDYKYK